MQLASVVGTRPEKDPRLDRTTRCIFSYIRPNQLCVGFMLMKKAATKLCSHMVSVTSYCPLGRCWTPVVRGNRGPKDPRPLERLQVCLACGVELETTVAEMVSTSRQNMTQPINHITPQI